MILSVPQPGIGTHESRGIPRTEARPVRGSTPTMWSESARVPVTDWPGARVAPDHQEERRAARGEARGERRLVRPLDRPPVDVVRHDPPAPVHASQRELALLPDRQFVVSIEPDALEPHVGDRDERTVLRIREEPDLAGGRAGDARRRALAPRGRG